MSLYKTMALLCKLISLGFPLISHKAQKEEKKEVLTRIKFNLFFIFLSSRHDNLSCGWVMDKKNTCIDEDDVADNKRSNLSARKSYTIISYDDNAYIDLREVSVDV
jgi:hypothetical protein